MKNDRLENVLKFINKEDRLADVGCDHGYLAVKAIKKGVSFVQLIDNKEGPLRSAKTNLIPYLTNATVKFSLSSGISSLENEVDTVAICGMGGELISQILSADIENAKKINKFILQANSKIELLRTFLKDNLFEIIDEDIVIDNNKVYEIIVTHYIGKIVDYNVSDLMFGPYLLKYKSNVFVDKWNKKLIYNKEIMKNMNENDSRYKEICNQIKLIEEVLK